MIRFRLLLVAENVVRDADTQRISAFNIFDAVVVAEGFPLLLPNLTVLTIIDRDADDAEESTGVLTITLGQHELMRGDFPVNFRGKQVHRHTGRVAGLIVPGPGLLTIRATLADGVAATYEIPVHGRQQPTLFETAQEPAAEENAPQAPQPQPVQRDQE